MGQLREFFWSARLAQWAPVAGLLAVLRVRRGAIAALLGGWLAAFLVVKGFSTRATIESDSFWRLLMPAWPAYLLLLASIPLLVPTLARRLGDRMRPPPTSNVVAPLDRRGRRSCTVAVPAVAIAASTPLGQPSRRRWCRTSRAGTSSRRSTTGSRSASSATAAGRRLDLDGRRPWRADVFYRVYRTTVRGRTPTASSREASRSYCVLRGQPIATTRGLTFVDASAPPTATYRIGVGTNWIDDPERGDVFAFSLPVAAAG